MIRALVATMSMTLVGGVVATPAPASIQDDLDATLTERARSLPEARRAFQETWLLPRGPAAATAEETTFAGRATVFQEGGRERVEIRRVEGDGLADPVVVIADGEAWWLVTPLGASPFAGSAPAGDRLVRLVLAGPAGDAPAHRSVTAPDGGITAVVLRHPLAAEFDPEEAFAIETTRGGSGLVKTGLSSFSAAGDAEVVAAAGARGVDRVRTANGTVSVTPDAAAVAWMEERGVSSVALEEFRLAERLPPYDALPLREERDDETEGGGR